MKQITDMIILDKDSNIISYKTLDENDIVTHNLSYDEDLSSDINYVVFKGEGITAYSTYKNEYANDELKKLKLCIAHGMTMEEKEFFGLGPLHTPHGLPNGFNWDIIIFEK